MTPKEPARKTRSRSAPIALVVLLSAAFAPLAPAQSFYDITPQIPLNETGEPDPDAPLRAVSMLYIDVPPPRRFEVHGVVTIIVDETSTSESKQSLDTKKEYDLGATLDEFPSLRHLLELQLEEGDSSPITSVGLSAEHDFKGEGQQKRSDRYVARITATIIDVKPNGNLVLEARRTLAHNEETKEIVLSGVCRQEDITDANTISSSQIAELTFVQTTSGQVDKASKKGLIPRVLEAIFNF